MQYQFTHFQENKRITYFGFNTKEEAKDFASKLGVLDEIRIAPYWTEERLEKIRKQTEKRDQERLERLRGYEKNHPSQYHIEMLPNRDITCDVCKELCWDREHMNIESAILYASWGYGSDYDTEEHFCNVCVKCYRKVFKFLKESIRRLDNLNGKEI